MNVRVEVTGASALIAALTARAAGIGPSVRRAVAASAGELKQTTQAIHSGGRPSAIVRTYNLHDSWTIALGEAEAVVGSGAPYARRIEFGFVGVDSLGRHYAQPPYPMLGPAVEQVRQFFEDQVRAAVAG